MEQYSPMVLTRPNSISTFFETYNYQSFRIVLVTGKDWTKTFYWTVDSLSSPDGKKLRMIESRVFRSQQSVILKELNNRKWRGSKEQNQYSDLKVSGIVKRTLEFD